MAADLKTGIIAAIKLAQTLSNMSVLFKDKA